MADMFDPSVAESIARNMKKSKEHADQLRAHLFTANDHAQKLQVSLVIVNNSLTSASRTSLALANNLKRASTGAALVGRHLSTTQQATGRVAKQTSQVAQQTSQVATNQQAAAKQSNLLKDTLTIITGRVLIDMLSTMKTLQSAGFAPVQAATQTWHSLLQAVSVTLSGYPTSMGAASKAIAGMSKSLGGTSMYSQDLLKNTIKLSSAYGMSVADATKLNSLLYRWTDGSDKAVKNTTDYVAALSKANNIAPGEVMAQMAQNSEVLARYGAQGAMSFAKMAIQIVRMGTTIKEMSGFADKLVNDFEGSLVMTAKLQTIMPGLDMSEVMMASQFGTEGDVAAALQSALKGSGLSDMSQLPRSLQNMLTNGLGLTKEGIQNLLHPPKITDAKIKPPSEANFDEKLDKVIGWLMGIAGLLAGGKLLDVGRKALGLGEAATKGVASGAAGATSVAGGKAAYSGTRAWQAKRFAAGRHARMTSLVQQGVAGRQASAAARAARLAGTTSTAAESGGMFAKLAGKASGIASKVGGIAGKAGGVLGKAAPWVAAALAIYDFVSQLREGQTVFKSLVNTVAHFFTLGLWTPFKKAERSLAAQQREQESLTKQTALLTSMFDKLGGKSIEYAKVAHAFITGNARKYDNNVKSKGAVGITGEVQSSMMSRQGGGGNSYINDMSFGPAKIKEMMKQSSLGQSVMGLAGKASGLLGGGLGGLVSAGKSGIGSLLGGIGGKAIGGLMTGGVGTALSLASSVFPGIGKTLGQVAKNPLGSVVNFAKNPGKAIGSVFKGIGGLFGKKKPTVQSVATAIAPLAPKILDGGLSKILGSKLGGQVSGAMQGITVNTQALESKMDQLIALFKRGGINVNMDGKKVSTSLAHANRYG